MNPDERGMLERALKLSEDNNKILRKMHRAARWTAVWGIIKLIIFVIPLVIGYLYLQPYLGPLGDLFQRTQEVLHGAP